MSQLRSFLSSSLTELSDEPDTVVNFKMLLPVAILCALFLWTATVTNLTASAVPFTIPEDERL